MGTVNGRPCKMLMDTGATQSFVNAEFISSEDILDGSISVCCIHGDTIDYPVAPIAVDIGGAKEIVYAAISKDLPHSTIIGWDAPRLLNQLLKGKNEQLSRRTGIGHSMTNPTSTALPQEKEGEM